MKKNPAQEGAGHRRRLGHRHRRARERHDGHRELVAVRSRTPRRRRSASASTPLPVETAVAKDGVAIYVNEANPVAAAHRRAGQGASTSATSRTGRRSAAPTRRSSSTPARTPPGTYVFFKEHVLGNEDFAAEAQTLPGTAAVVNAVAKEKNGIGYGGAAYAKGVKEVKIVGKDGQGYLPNAENVKAGKYPLSRPLFMYTRGDARRRGEGVHRLLPLPGGAGDRDAGRVLPDQVTASPNRHTRATGRERERWLDPRRASSSQSSGGGGAAPPLRHAAPAGSARRRSRSPSPSSR